MLLEDLNSAGREACEPNTTGLACIVFLQLSSRL